jgi:hypothetical protein
MMQAVGMAEGAPSIAPYNGLSVVAALTNRVLISATGTHSATTISGCFNCEGDLRR